MFGWIFSADYYRDECRFVAIELVTLKRYYGISKSSAGPKAGDYIAFEAEVDSPFVSSWRSVNKSEVPPGVASKSALFS